ncbi:LOW QUALITY PROTEIN: hypothetical protein PAHAL_7G291900 [Panicum hallii]|uniref:Uncharacterized protein n=1 Tax=Panicum hallii TaxID=206008 RepID=A0A2S3IAC9_9POAL|nr:LOW QUALITY PROTEIN: hypothetical protein PAHAL_7G291900 [Panicum hallii]
MASIKLSLAAVVALLFGLVVAGAVGKHECGFHCVDGSRRFHGCNCACGPSDGRVCVVHNPDGSAVEDCPK